MTTDIEGRLKAAYLANGGTEEEFHANKSELITQYRSQATIAAALEEAAKPPDMNALLREMPKREDHLIRLFPDTSGGESA